MSPPGSKQKQTVNKVKPRRVSPSDAKLRMAEAEARARSDTRTDAQRWLGDPAPARSALAQRASVMRSPSPAAPSASAPPRFASWSGNVGRLHRFK